ncbi:MAG: THUMP domain-containing protein [Thermoplasmata archaeon]
MFARIYYFKNRDELHKKIKFLKEYFLKNDGQFIYKEQDTKLIIISNTMIEGQEAFIFRDYEEIINFLENIHFKKFAIRSRRKNSQIENRNLGKLVLERLKEKRVDLEDPDITIYIDQIKNLSYFFIK